MFLIWSLLPVGHWTVRIAEYDLKVTVKIAVVKIKTKKYIAIRKKMKKAEWTTR
jgi:hypothetical protein